MILQVIGGILYGLGVFFLSFIIFRFLAGRYVQRNRKWARVRVEMKSGVVEHVNIPYLTENHLTYSLTLISKANYRKDKSSSDLKIVADEVLTVTVVHKNWPMSKIEQGSDDDGE